MRILIAWNDYLLCMRKHFSMKGLFFGKFHVKKNDVRLLIRSSSGNQKSPIIGTESYQCLHHSLLPTHPNLDKNLEMKDQFRQKSMLFLAWQTIQHLRIYKQN